MKMVPISTLKLHPEADRVPMMRTAEQAEFEADIAERGIRVPLELIPGSNMVIDGRQRLTAAKNIKLGEVPVVDANLNGDDPVLYMLRAASKRRHLTDDQRGMLANEEREYLAGKAKKERASAAGKTGGRNHPKEKVSLSDAASDKLKPSAPSRSKAVKADSRKQAAAHHNVSERKVKQAKKVKDRDAKLAEKVKAGEVPLATATRKVDRDHKLAELDAKVAAAPVAQPGQQPWKIIHGDCLEHLSQIESGTVRLIFAEPPYNIGIDDGHGKKADRLDDADYLAWAQKWINLCTSRLAADGSLWVMMVDEYADHLGLLLRQAGLHRRAWIKWFESFGVNQANNFNRCSRHIFYCVKDPKRFVFNADAVTNADGKTWDDVWGKKTPIPRLTESVMERLPGFPAQLPLGLLRAVVGCASDAGDLVLDPFSGSATTGVACIELGRRYVGIEQSLNFVELSTKRLQGVGQ